MLSEYLLEGQVCLWVEVFSFCVFHHIMLFCLLQANDHTFQKLSHKCLHLLGVVGDALGAEESATVGSDEQVVLDTDAAEVLVSL